MRRFLLALGLTAGLLVLTPSPSWACSCAIDGVPQQVRHAVTVAAGTVAWTSSNSETRTYEVDVDTVYQGAAGRSEKLVTAVEGSACGIGDLAPGRRYLFFIEGRHPGAMPIERCGGTTTYDDTVVRQIESITGPPGKPLPDPDGRADDETSAGGVRGRPAVIGGAAVALAAIASGVLRAVRRRAGRSR